MIEAGGGVRRLGLAAVIRAAMAATGVEPAALVYVV
jgi:hypothetical protein